MMMARDCERMRATPYSREYGGYRRPGRVKALGLELTILAGDADSLSVYHDRNNVYILAENTQLDYVGLEVFDRKIGESIGDAFRQADGRGDDDRPTVERLLSWAHAPRKIRFLLDYISE